MLACAEHPRRDLLDVVVEERLAHAVRQVLEVLIPRDGGVGLDVTEAVVARGRAPLAQPAQRRRVLLVVLEEVLEPLVRGRVRVKGEGEG